MVAMAMGITVKGTRDSHLASAWLTLSNDKCINLREEDKNGSQTETEWPEISFHSLSFPTLSSELFKSLLLSQLFLPSISSSLHGAQLT